MGLGAALRMPWGLDRPLRWCWGLSWGPFLPEDGLLEPLALPGGWAGSGPLRATSPNMAQKALHLWEAANWRSSAGAQLSFRPWYLQ